MNAFETIIFEVDGHVAAITLNRPEVLNVHNVAMKDELCEVLEAIASDREIRSVVVKGAGEKAFCAGADLSEFLTAPPPAKARQIRLDQDLWERFTNMPQPLIAALHGFVLGSGVEIALCCDIRFAGKDARFGLPEVGLGIIPAAGGTQTVPRSIGISAALEMMLANCWLDADEAKKTGLVNMVVEREVLYDKAFSAARKIADFNPHAVRSIKQAVDRGMDLPLSKGLDLERRLALEISL